MCDPRTVNNESSCCTDGNGDSDGEDTRGEQATGSSDGDDTDVSICTPAVALSGTTPLSPQHRTSRALSTQTCNPPMPTPAFMTPTSFGKMLTAMFHPDVTDDSSPCGRRNDDAGDDRNTTDSGGDDDSHTPATDSVTH